MFNPNNINDYNYDLYLCDLSKTQLHQINYDDIKYDENKDMYDELNFTVPSIDNGWRKMNNKYFNILEPFFLILMEVKNDDDLIFQEYFMIDSVTATSEGDVNKKNIKCYSSDSVFNNYYLNNYEEVKMLYDTVGANGILNDMLSSINNIWTIKYMSSSLNNIYRSFNFSNASYRSVIETLSEQFNVYFIFDTTDDTISIYDLSGEGYGEDSEIIISDENYISSLSIDIKGSEMVSKLKIFGADNISIEDQHSLGKEYILDYSWARNNNRMSTSLASAYDAWLIILSNNETIFQGYLSSLNSLRATLLTKQNELIALELELKNIEENLDLSMVTRRNNATYDSIFLQQIAKEASITSKKSEITIIQNQISGVNANIIALASLLSLTSNFTLAQRQELSKLTIEETLKIDGISNSGDLYNYGLQYLQIKNKPSIDCNIDLIDLFSINDSYIQSKYTKLKKGNFIYIDCPNLGFNYEQYRITQISHDKLNNNLSITISNKDKLNTELYYLNRIFTESAKASSTLNVNKEDYSKYVKESDDILYNDSEINTENNKIKIGNDNYITARGFQGNSLDTRNGTLKIQGDQIIYSNNNMQDYYAILSADGLYLEAEDGNSRTVITPTTGFQLDVWNSEVNDWRNALYVGLESENPVVKLDNGYIQLSRYVEGVEVNQIKINPELGIVINKWDTTILNWIPVFYISPSGTIITKELIAEDSIIQGNFSTGFTFQPRIEINDNGIISYNANNQKHGLYVSSEKLTDLFLYKNDIPMFGIYDNINSISLYCGEASSPYEILVAQRSDTGSIISPQNNWNFIGATVTNLNGYAEESYVDGNFASSLSYNSTTKVLSLKNANGNTLSTVTLT